MKNLSILFSFFILITGTSTIYSQSPWAIIGYNGSTGDGISIVAIEDIPPSTTIFFTDKAYSDTRNEFDSGESVISYTTPTKVTSKGEVVTFAETGDYTNIFTVSCSSGVCGNYNVESGSVSYASTTSEAIYLYTDTNNDPTDGITEIYAAFVSRLTFPFIDENPVFDYPNCVIVDGFPNLGDHRDYINGLRIATVTKAELEDPNNYDVSTTSGNEILDNTPFAEIALPVKLVGFNGRAVNNNRIVLNWSTVSEINNDRFEIERSNDGKTFQRIGTRLGKGNSFSKVNYDFTDINPSNKSNYYRLKQIDHDGAYVYSNIIQVNMQVEEYDISVGPNPFSEYIELKSAKGFDQSVQIQILDINGQLVYNRSFDGKDATLFISLTDLNTGNYFLKINDGQNETVKRLIKI